MCNFLTNESYRDMINRVSTKLLISQLPFEFYLVHQFINESYRDMINRVSTKLLISQLPFEFYLVHQFIFDAIQN